MFGIDELPAAEIRTWIKGTATTPHNPFIRFLLRTLPDAKTNSAVKSMRPRMLTAQ